MKRTLLTSGMILAVCLASLAAFAQADSKVKYNGYLMDKMCSGEVMESKDPQKAAKEHTKSCALMRSCVASGYGIVSGGKFYAFDAHGNELAKAILKRTKKQHDLSIEVVGTPTKDGKIQVESLTETK